VDRSQLQEQLQYFRMDAKAITALFEDQAPEPTEFPVLPENWDACQLYLAVQTQWRTSPVGGLIGLDYNAVDVVFRRRRFKDSPVLFEQLQLMERTTLDAWEKRSRK
jgi:hypothetical protein